MSGMDRLARYWRSNDPTVYEQRQQQVWRGSEMQARPLHPEAPTAPPVPPGDKHVTRGDWDYIDGVKAGLRAQRAETLVLLRDLLDALQHPFAAERNAALQQRVAAAIAQAEEQGNG